jgi:N-acetylmuramoyl-L-alanine amidase
MQKERHIFVRVTALLLLLLASGSAAEPRRISVYAPQANYQVDILLRNGVDYVGLTDLLEPLGRLETRTQGSKLTLIFNSAAADFQDGKKQYRTGANSHLELAASFLIVDGRGYIPAASITQLLASVAGQSAEFHTVPRRLFVGGTQLHFSAELRHAPTRLVLSFSAPVNPATQVEKGRVHLLFRREPVVGTATGTAPDAVSYNDAFLLGTSFTELPNSAEFIANVQQPATVSISDGGRTVTISPAAAPASQPPAAPVAGSAASQSAPTPRPNPFVILDAAHGGAETGELLSPTLLEKNVNLALVRRLQKELESRGIPVVLTRNTDAQLTWDQRAISANTSHAALYVALHASTSGHGLRIYTSLLASPPTQAQPTFFPWELAQWPHLGQSSQAAAALAAQCTADGLPVRSSAAPVRPLNSVTVAAVAVELAPLGASTEELGSAEYQQKIAESLAAGIASLRTKLEAAQ